MFALPSVQRMLGTVYYCRAKKPSGISGNHTVCLGMSIGMLCLLPFAAFSGAIDRVFELPNLYFLLVLRF